MLTNRTYAQEIENGIFTCLSQAINTKDMDWKANCDRILSILPADSLNAKTLISYSCDSAWLQQVPAEVRKSLKTLASDSSIRFNLERCILYFAHIDGHELQVQGYAGLFIGLFKQKASHDEYIQFFSELPDEVFNQPLYYCVFLTWMVSYP